MLSNMGVKFVASNNILIVESNNDKTFIEALLGHINNIDLTVDTPICNIDEYKSLDGLSEASLKSKLTELSIQIEKDGIEKIGILLDADDDGIEAKITIINSALDSVGAGLTVEETNKWYRSDGLEVDVACHVLNLDGAGELETVLKSIKCHDSAYADCLSSWRECLHVSGNEINDKTFDKFWVNIYQRYDCCNKEEQRQAGRRCNFKASLQKGIWDFDHPNLSDLQAFLLMFNQT